MNIPVSVLWGSKNTKQFPFRLIFILTLQDDKLSAALTFHNSLRTSVISYQFAFLGPHWFFHWHSGNQWMTSDPQLLLRGYCWIIKMRIFSDGCFVLFSKGTHDEKITASTSIQKYVYIKKSTASPFYRTTLEADLQCDETNDGFVTWIWSMMGLFQGGKKKKTWARNKPASRFLMIVRLWKTS